MNRLNGGFTEKPDTLAIVDKLRRTLPYLLPNDNNFFLIFRNTTKLAHFFPEKYVKHALIRPEPNNMHGIWVQQQHIAYQMKNRQTAVLYARNIQRNVRYITFIYLSVECVCSNVKLETAEK